nr:MAG TPA: hypothetical protein [Caudoviricetes sp.]
MTDTSKGKVKVLDITIFYLVRIYITIKGGTL